jgi:molecular chaperone Hsp33
MIKTKLPLTDKQYLLARDSDRMTQFVADGGSIRGAYVQGNLVMKEMAANHELGVFETYVLGQAYLAGLLMASTLKGEDRLNLSVTTDGPAGGFTVDANAFGEVRGYLDQKPFRVPAEWTEPTLAQILGTGLLSVTRYAQKDGVPVTGSVEYQSASLALSLAHYYDQSEQIPTAFDLSVKFDRQGALVGAGGLVLQVLPGYDPQRWEAMAHRLYELPAIGENAAESHDPAALLSFWFSDFEPKILANRRVEFFCPCSKNKFGSFLKNLPEKDRTEILADGPFPLATNCHNCASTYEFSRAELQALWNL